MTAVHDWELVGDATLAGAALAGDRAAFAQIYDRYADRLYDFCLGMVRDRDIAADCVQDTFCTVVTRLETLREADKLRPWLYAIARNEALRRIRERQREQPSDELPESASSEPGPDDLAARTELAELISHAAGGLSDRDREVLDLTYRHGLDGPELAQALGVSPASARTLTHRLRETIERSLGALLVARRARTGRGCPELTASLVDWDGELTMLTRKRIARHIDSCDTCSDDRRKLVDPVALLGATPLFIPAPTSLRDRTMDRFELTSASSAIVHADGSGHDSGIQDQRRRLPQVVATVAAAGIALGVALLWPESEPTPSAPVVNTEAVTRPNPQRTQIPVVQAPSLPPPIPGPSITGVAPANLSPIPQTPPTAAAPAGATAPTALAEPDPLQPPVFNPQQPLSNAPNGVDDSDASSSPAAPSVAVTPPQKTYAPAPPSLEAPPSKPSIPSDTSTSPNSISPPKKFGDPAGSTSPTSGGSSGSPSKPDTSSKPSQADNSSKSSSSAGSSGGSASSTKQ